MPRGARERHRERVPSTSVLLTFAAASLALLVIPGPSVLFTIGRALSSGRSEAVLTVFGNGIGTYAQAVALALGLGPLVAASSVAFTALKLAGAAYLVVMGVRAVRSRKVSAAAFLAGTRGRVSAVRSLRDGFAVGATNPKTFVFLAALLPQFVHRTSGPVWSQVLVLAAILVGLGFVTDSGFALAAGQARVWLARSPRRMERVGGTGGVMMASLGIGLLFTGRPTT